MTRMRGRRGMCSDDKKKRSNDKTGMSPPTKMCGSDNPRDFSLPEPRENGFFSFILNPVNRL